MLYPFLASTSFSKIEYQRYARHLVLNDVGVSGQKRLKNASVLFVGAGGLGSPGIIYLASSGIGSIGVIDHDIISYSNLHRQILYNHREVDNLKVNVAHNKIAQINPECIVSVYPFSLNQTNCQDIIEKYDLVVDASDNFKARYLIDQACYEKHKIHVYGAIQGFEGHLSVFNYRSGSLYSDLYPDILKLQDNNCSNLGILPVLTGIIGTLQATEVMKIILGLGEVLSGHLLVYNSLSASFKRIRIPSRDVKRFSDYQFSNQNVKLLSSINQHCMTVSTHDFNSILVDIRDPIEFSKEHLLKSINIPLRNIRSKSVISFIDNYFLSRKIVVYCYDNLRSIIVSQILTNSRIDHCRLNC